ncbi:UV DNA damage repair endonuclease UvsE [Ammoniphilus sp. CFH 90114]|uniref:UV DNA damage repair endonuclease UvsE n=1 Tax=Ammoniphilus sp. CFH 90114 TaxID=2493665 RepID=UPI00100F6CDC|nr:UV DNA damage repair endonuclease UvsE [Ammoniphilus sp. CFH 90114]RXT05212.1 UV DNA damage repair endonuclease UvsE [Ammoniphilus sp. CFH 90114]
MRVRLGYVALSLEVKDSSPNKTITWKNLQKVDPKYYISRLRILSKENLKNQLRLLRYNLGEEIMVYRFTSKLIPLATHEAAAGWNFAEDLAEEFAQIGEFVRKHKMRVGFHPDHFVNLNSPKEDIVEKSIQDLQYHLQQSQAMGMDEKMKFNIHMGGAYQDKQKSLKRLIDNWSQVPEVIQKRLTFENDDKTFTAHETLEACQALNIPMVLDIHHHRCNHEHQDLSSILPDIFATWKDSGLPPKIHVSSPRGTESSAALRSHADLVNLHDLLPFLQLASKHTDALDVMVEAKNKDQALKGLMNELVAQEGIEKITEASFEI